MAEMVLPSCSEQLREFVEMAHRSKFDSGMVHLLMCKLQEDGYFTRSLISYCEDWLCRKMTQLLHESIESYDLAEFDHYQDILCQCIEYDYDVIPRGMTPELMNTYLHNLYKEYFEF